METQTQEPLKTYGDVDLFNDHLKDYAGRAGDWDFRETAKFLHEWVERFNEEFKLGIDTPAIRIERVRATRLGSYRDGRNGHGLNHEITLNTRHLRTASVSDILDTLLHELLHEWQDLHGKPGKHNYHNRQFIEKAASYGLLVDKHGHSLGVTPGPFTELLAKYVVDTIPLPKPAEPILKPAAETKMKKWVCECEHPTIIRAATQVEALCLRCQKLFRRA